MKRLTLILALLVTGAVYADKTSNPRDHVVEADAPYTERGVSITEWLPAEPTLTFTNVATEPWYPVSIITDGDGVITNTLTITVKRLYDLVYQGLTNVVTTNAATGWVETNSVPWQQTNIAYRVYTGTVWSATVTGDVDAAISRPFWFKAFDVIDIGQTYTNTGKHLILNGSRN